MAPDAGSRGQAEAVKAAINAGGAKTGNIESTTDKEGVRHSKRKFRAALTSPILPR